MSNSTQFEKLFTILDNSEYALDIPFKKVIREAVENAGFCEEERTTKNTTKKKTQKTTKKGVLKTEKKRKVSSYNLFVGHQIKIEGKTMAQAVPLWKQLGEKENSMSAEYFNFTCQPM